MRFEDQIARWFNSERSISAAILIGSRARSQADEVWKADGQSDWDFHLISSRPEIFESDLWLKSEGLVVRSYATRRTTIGNVPKALAVVANSEADFVILPSLQLQLWRAALYLNLHRRFQSVLRILQDLAIVIRPGWQFWKGERKWGRFYSRVTAEIPDPRLDDAVVCELASNFVCDVFWILRKIERGEWLTAQRMFHRVIAETNFKLLHELKLRNRERSFPDVRRAERVLSASEYEAIKISITPDPTSLRLGLEKASETFRQLIAALVGDKWQWPQF